MTFSSDERSKLVSTLSNSLALFLFFIFIFFASETYLKVHTALTGIKKKGLTWAFGCLTFHGRFEGEQKNPPCRSRGRRTVRTRTVRCHCCYCCCWHRVAIYFQRQGLCTVVNKKYGRQEKRGKAKMRSIRLLATSNSITPPPYTHAHTRKIHDARRRRRRECVCVYPGSIVRNARR